MRKTLSRIIFAAAFAACLPAAAAAEGFSIGYAQDVVHAPGTQAVIARYDHAPTRLGGQAMYWDGSDGENFSFGIDYDLLPSPILDLNLGGVYITEVREINGTHLNYSISLGINIWKYARVQFSHFSNGQAKNNDGWNFVGALFRF